MLKGSLTVFTVARFLCFNREWLFITARGVGNFATPKNYNPPSDPPASIGVRELSPIQNVVGHTFRKFEDGLIVYKVIKQNVPWNQFFIDFSTTYSRYP